MYGEGFDEAKFTELAGESGTMTQEEVHAYFNASLKNSAFVFIKPHANFEATQTYVKGALEAAGCTVLSEGAISGEEIDSKKLIDQHYYAIASKATILKPAALAVPADKFEEFFKESWETVLAEDRAVNAMDACERFGVDSSGLEKAWRGAEAEGGKVVKFGGGFYCGNVTVDGKSLYVFNAFFMAMRSKFVGPENSIYYYSVEFDPAVLAWADFRGKVLGPTNPADAPADSIRGTILAKWQELGLAGEPNTSDNGVHASASPLEGLAEKMNWLQKEIKDESFGAALLRNGLTEETIKAWSVDPRVDMEGGAASIFDSLEDISVAECLAKCVAINSFVKPPANAAEA
jgi:hypothetical protein